VEPEHRPHQARAPLVASPRAHALRGRERKGVGVERGRESLYSSPYSYITLVILLDTHNLSIELLMMLFPTQRARPTHPHPAREGGRGGFVLVFLFVYTIYKVIYFSGILFY
jgi:hypothetical protein